jgi:hypothetical protein
MLPESAQEELRKAAQTQTDKDPAAREKAIDMAIDRLRLVYPHHFKGESDDKNRGRQ